MFRLSGQETLNLNLASQTRSTPEPHGLDLRSPKLDRRYKKQANSMYICICTYMLQNNHKNDWGLSAFWDCGSSKTSRSLNLFGLQDSRIEASQHWQTRRGERWVNGGSTIYIYICTYIICVFSQVFLRNPIYTPKIQNQNSTSASMQSHFPFHVPCSFSFGAPLLALCSNNIPPKP